MMSKYIKTISIELTQFELDRLEELKTDLNKKTYTGVFRRLLKDVVITKQEEMVELK